MEIKLDLNSGNVQRVPAAQPAVRPPETQVQSESAQFDRAAALDKALEQTPDVRPEVVEQGKSLAADTQYPPRETLQRIATLLAMQMDG